MVLTNKYLKWVLGLCVVAVLAALYRTYNPLEHSFFPKCPFLVATGYQCAGCGSQRAVHHLLHLDLAQAMRENVLLVVSAPYILFGFVIDNLKHPPARLLRWRKRLYGLKAIMVVLVVIVAFWILRNTDLWPELL